MASAKHHWVRYCKTYDAQKICDALGFVANKFTDLVFLGGI